jgi:cell division protein FtsZ
VVFNLDTFEVETPQVINETLSELIPTTDSIRNLDVFFEIVSPIAEQPKPVFEQTVAPIASPVVETIQPITQEFEIITSQVREIEVVEPQFVVAKDEFNFSLDLFNAKSEAPTQNTIVFDLSNEVKEMKVNEPVQVMPVTEMNQNGVIRYTLEEEIEIASEPMAETKVNTIPIEEELNFTVRQTSVVDAVSNLEVSPLEMSIEDTLRARAEERKRKLKDFNYKFNNPGRIDELEKEPAFKRQGLDVTSMPNQNNQSRLSLGLDSNDDVQLRSNNSFLHDNVD